MLAKLFLDMNIQCGGKLGHDSIEDSRAAMLLVQLKLSKCMYEIKIIFPFLI